MTRRVGADLLSKASSGHVGKVQPSRYLYISGLASSVTDRKRLFPDPDPGLDPTFQVIPDPYPNSFTAQTQIF